MNSFRKEKFSSLLAQLISGYIQKHIQSESKATTLTRLDVSDDFKKVVIFVTMYPEETQRKTLESLKKDLPELRKEIGKKLKMRFLPSFEFVIDEGEKNRMKIEEIIERLSAEGKFSSGEKKNNGHVVK